MLAEGGDYAQQFITEAKRDMIIITGSANNFSKSLAVCKEIIPISATSQTRMIHTHTQTHAHAHTHTHSTCAHTFAVPTFAHTNPFIQSLELACETLRKTEKCKIK